MRPEPFTIVSNDGLRVFQTGSPSFAQNTVSVFFLIFSAFLRVYGHIWPRRGCGGRLEVPHAVGHGGMRGEAREVGGWG